MDLALNGINGLRNNKYGCWISVTLNNVMDGFTCRSGMLEYTLQVSGSGRSALFG